VTGGWTKAILIAGGAVLLGGVALVLFLSSAKSNRNEECQFHMMRLFIALNSAETGESKEWDSQPAGRRFWDRSSGWPGARMPIDRRDLVCPVLGRTEPGLGPDHVDYRGPSRSLRLLGADDPVAADREGNHLTRGNVLLKSGTIVEADDAMWARASRTTSD
jgi:hypothetical protein